MRIVTQPKLCARGYRGQAGNDDAVCVAREGVPGHVACLQRAHGIGGRGHKKTGVAIALEP